ncbi:MAG TPA: family 78 glycoside hydrolase catalytic domain [Candidatus Acidoferrales bacterium]|nr:family 78 glycoside hydrolase catalytic domain [Candidatus Acidoferrales bacterium]
MIDFTRRGFLAAAGAAPLLRSQSLLRRAWSARWIAVPDSHPTEYGVYYFRRAFDLAAKPERFLVHASGDNRYQLFVNGRRVAWGPARGDLFHWRYESVDLAPHLAAGRNAVAAVVWNFSDLAPEAQVTLQTGFVLQGDGEAERIIDTGPAWRCMRDPAYSAVTSFGLRAYYVVGPGDRVNAAAHPWGWESVSFDDTRWPAAAVIGPAAGREARDVHSRWMLMPRTIPAMEERAEPAMQVRRVEGAASWSGSAPANSKVVVLFDQGYLTTGHPELTVSGGKDAVVRLRYAEALSPKGDRNQIEGKQVQGNYDELVPDGGARRMFRPLWWRTWRYLQLEIETKAEPLTVDSLTATYVGYPFVRRAKFDAGVPELNRILDVGWRTARLCAHETYMDCPYYEQLQYAGDTRVQCLVSLFQTGDARLMRNAIDLLNDSRQSDGCTMSRYPTRLEQYIPGFALWWIGMVHDYWWYVEEPAFVRRMLPGVRSVLSFFEQYQKQNGSLGSLPWWRYFDWVPEWPNGDAPQEADGGAALFDLHLVMAYRWAAELEGALGLKQLAGVYSDRERQLRETAQELYWDAGRQMYADTPAKQKFSQHTNTLAVLADVATGQGARDLMLRILTAQGLAQGALYFKFYLHQALAKVGEGDRYLDLLGDWRQMLAKGLTTFAETMDRPNGASRSDCHAWSASPDIEIPRTVLGVDSAAPGFARVAVRPHLGKLAFAEGAVPHPKGMIEARVEAGGAVSVTLPAGVSGTFEWRGAKRDLAPGANRFQA